jgi:hypothetical protein
MIGFVSGSAGFASGAGVGLAAGSAFTTVGGS